MEAIIADNLHCIEQAIGLLGGLDERLYTFASSQTLGASIGGHIRHNIDHYESFLNRRAPDRIDYERRKRDPVVESDSTRAAAKFRSIQISLQNIETAHLDRPIEVKIETPGDAPGSQWAPTTERRELQFLLSHSVHDYALIAMICRLHHTAIPENFGVAPSTLKHRQLSETAECVQ